tara:strand:+ start:78 stop:440 length:363 start_codon:yes stop_codon:yes gene_type:complete
MNTLLQHNTLTTPYNSWNLGGNLEKCKEFIGKAEALGKEHMVHANGSKKDGKNMINIAKKALAKALNGNGKVEEAKEILQKCVLEGQKDKEEEMKAKEEMAVKAATDLEAEKVKAAVAEK